MKKEKLFPVKKLPIKKAEEFMKLLKLTLTSPVWKIGGSGIAQKKVIRKAFKAATKRAPKEYFPH